jgi:predicted transcriptional regulator
MRTDKAAKLRTVKRPCKACGGKGAIESVDPTALRTRREDAGVSMGEMARRLGFSVPYISDVELGRRNVTERVAAEYEKL